MRRVNSIRRVLGVCDTGGMTASELVGSVVAVQSSEAYSFSKSAAPSIQVVAGLGVVGDVHAGGTVRHRSRVAADPTQPNLRQVHLMHAELFDVLRTAGYDVTPGQLGENVTTSGLDLLAVPIGALLRVGAEALLCVTGLRNPCVQIDGVANGLLAQLVGRDADGALVRKAGVMTVVVQGGTIRPGDAISVVLPPEPRSPLKPV